MLALSGQSILQAKAKDKEQQFNKPRCQHSENEEGAPVLCYFCNTVLLTTHTMHFVVAVKPDLSIYYSYVCDFTEEEPAPFFC